MNRKRLTALLLAAFMLAALLPSAAFAEETVSAAGGLVSLSFTGSADMELSNLKLLDGAGNVVLPLDDRGGSYLLAPGVYSYYYVDGSGAMRVPVTTLTLSGSEGKLEISLADGTKRSGAENAEAQSDPMEVPLWSAGEAPAREEQETASPRQDGPAMPVVFRCAVELDYSCLRVYDSGGFRMQPYTDPNTGNTQYENYLLAPGAYSYTYRDSARRLAELDGSFTVQASGVQYVTLELTDADGGMCFSATAVNPAYANVINPAYIPAPATSPEESLEQLRRDVDVLSGGDGMSATYNAGSNVIIGKESNNPWPTPVVYDNPADSGAGLRRNLILRQNEIAICVRCRIKPTNEVWRSMCWMIYDEAIRHSGAPTEGDYLRYEYGGVTCNGSAITSSTPGEYYYKFIYAPLYFTTLAQETELNGRVQEILSSLNLSGKSVPQKITAVYQYLCERVEYVESEDPMIFTAYSALVRGKAACQGFSVAFYRLCLELGIDARIVTSLEMGHAWNIVSTGGRNYYAVDATWDAGKIRAQWKYFLRGRTSWLTEHKLGDEFIDGRFDDYNFPLEDYDGSSPEPGTELKIYSVSMFFEGMLRIRYYFEIPDELLRMSGARIQFSRDGEVFQTLSLSDAIRVKEYCCYDCGIRGDSLAEPIQAKILNGAGQNLPISSESGAVFQNGIYFSALEYAKEMKSKATSSSMRALAQALEDYCYASENAFRKAGNPLRREVTSVRAADLANWGATIRGQAPNGLYYADLSATLESDNSLRLYLHYKSGANPDGLRYQIDGRNVSLHKTGYDTYFLSVDNIAANALDTAHSFTISDGTRSCTITASVLSCARLMIENGDTDTANLGKALYLYSRAADAYFG